MLQPANRGTRCPRTLRRLCGNITDHHYHQPRITRRGTIYEMDVSSSTKSSNSQDEETSICSQDLVDSCPSAGFDDIKKYLKRSRERMIYVKAGLPYLEHVKLTEDEARAEEENTRPVESDMELQSLSSLCLPPILSDDEDSSDDDYAHIIPLRHITESPPSTTSSSCNKDSQCGSPVRLRVLKISDTFSDTVDHARLSSKRWIPRSLRGAEVIRPTAQKVTLAQVSSGITTALHYKERQFRDHFNYLKSIHNILTALNNMRLRDLRSKVPLSKEWVMCLQKEGVDRDKMGSRATYTSRFGKNIRTSTATVDMDDDNQINPRMSMLGTVKRMTTVDNINKNVFGRRRSRNTTDMSKVDRAAVETWEDLINIQPQEYKEDPSVGFLFNLGVVSKFMRWYKRVSVTPGHTSTSTPTHTLDTSTLSRLEDIRDKCIKEKDRGEPAERESYGETHRTLGSAVQVTERQKKLPIWLQVAQEKSTVYTNKKLGAPNHDHTIQRFRRDFAKLKRSMEKENNAELERLIREKVASFRLKFSCLSADEFSPLFEEQIYRVQMATDKVNRPNMEKFEVQPSKWYEELREKSQIMNILFEQPEITEMIAKLQTFAHMDNKTVPYSKAKLCLLMMSLPAYDICQIHMQRGLKFVFENILLGQEAQFLEWLNQRKLPYVVAN